MKTYYDKYKSMYLRRFIEESKKPKGRGLTRKELKRILYADAYLTDDEKDKMWETIIRYGKQ